MSQTIRSFIAVPVSLPAGLRSILRQIREMGRAVKANDAESPHITLKFLGDTQPEQVPDLARVLESVIADFQAFELELAGIGAFPHWDRPMVAWAGVKEPEPLTEIAQRLETELEPLGFPKERRAYHPHLTLARIKAKPPAALKEIADANEAKSFGSQTIEEIVLFQSELKKPGPTYTRLESITLRK